MCQILSYCQWFILSKKAFRKVNGHNNVKCSCCHCCHPLPGSSPQKVSSNVVSVFHCCSTFPWRFFCLHCAPSKLLKKKRGGRGERTKYYWKERSINFSLLMTARISFTIYIYEKLKQVQRGKMHWGILVACVLGSWFHSFSWWQCWLDW